jgi:predicted house-cleaning NTP pyrophosphatase (Maf/HAM1 superfamily)
LFFFFQAEDGIRDAQESRGLGDVYKRQVLYRDKTKRVLKGRNDKTYVWFKKLSDREIEWYLQTGEPLDKAGAYGIQGYGAIFIEKIFGDYFTVMGLSPRVLYNLLKEIFGEERSLKLLKGYNRTF